MIDLKKCPKPSERALKIAAKVELEHTNNIWIAKRIAAQHICENKNYYKLLKKAGL